jgi:hypothetical protein
VNLTRVFDSVYTRQFFVRHIVSFANPIQILTGPDNVINAFGALRCRRRWTCGPSAATHEQPKQEKDKEKNITGKLHRVVTTLFNPHPQLKMTKGQTWRSESPLALGISDCRFHIFRI